jgi:hypothetical protein
VVFWRLSGLSGGVKGNGTSATWMMRVRPKGSPVDTSWGASLDLNADGYEDLAVMEATVNVQYYFLGGPTGLPSLSTFDVEGPYPGNGAGGGIHRVGDVNGDGFADVLVQDYKQKLLIYPGGAGGLSPVLPVDVSQGGLFGFFGVVPAGDLNGDGYGDALLKDIEGKLRPLLGGPGGLTMSGLSTIPCTNSASSASLTSVGDLNGDGFPDFAAGACKNDPVGKVYVLLGTKDGLPPAPTLELAGEAGKAGFGGSVRSAGDVNGDGFADLLVSMGGGQVGVYLGSAAGVGPSPATVLAASDPGSGIGGGTGVGDVNGDGFDDVAVVQSWDGPGMDNAVLVYLGGPSGVESGPQVTLKTSPTVSFGVAVLGGDFDGDGFYDVAVSNQIDFGFAGELLVFRGSASGVSPTPAYEPHGYNYDFGYRVALLQRGRPAPIRPHLSTMHTRG